MHKEKRFTLGHSFLRTRLFATLLAVASVFSYSSVQACNVPVFRYALERWEEDIYEVNVFYRGSMTVSDKALMRKLVDKSVDSESSYANFYVNPMDVDKKIDEYHQGLWENKTGSELPWVMIRYPRPKAEMKTDVMWEGRLNSPELSTLVSSPARLDIARRILKGESAVWVMIESTDSAKNKKTFDELNMILTALEQELVLPVLNPNDPEDETSENIELKLDFSSIKISRKDPKEAMFINMLLGMDAKLESTSGEPVLIPVFGRGRALTSFVGKDIDEFNLFDAAKFLIGPCSCQVKDLNPGTDVIMPIRWEDLVDGTLVVDHVLPPLTGVSQLIEAPEGKVENLSEGLPIKEEGVAIAEGENFLLRNVIIVAILGLLCVVTASVLIKGK